MTPCQRKHILDLLSEINKQQLPEYPERNKTVRQLFQYLESVLQVERKRIRNRERRAANYAVSGVWVD